MSSCLENQKPVVENPSVEFLLKQTYMVYKEEMQSLSEKLFQANEKLLNRSPCTFCSTLTKKVEDLRNQVKQLLQEKQQPKITVDACVQTDTPQVSAPPSEKSCKRIIIYSSPRKRPCTSEKGIQKSPFKKPGGSDAYNTDEEVILAPNTPENDPQRQGRVKRWLQTMEIPETVDPDMLRGGIMDSQYSVRNGLATDSRRDPLGDSETDLDETMLPQDCLNVKTKFCNNEDEKKDPFEYSSASSEDLLEGAVLQSNKNKSGLNVLSDVGNKTLGTRKPTPLKQTVLPFKYKCDEPVRKKRDRMRLPAQQCTDCAKYYQNDDNGEKYKNICSRHRAVHEAPATPEHFWELDFPDTELCKERGYLDKTQKVKMLTRRKRPFVQQ